VLGILDLALALGHGLPHHARPFQCSPSIDRTRASGTYPLVMIPAFAVPLSLILHGLSLWQLRRTARAPASPAG